VGAPADVALLSCGGHVSSSTTSRGPSPASAVLPGRDHADGEACGSGKDAV
jgi:hypothetical protein